MTIHSPYPEKEGINAIPLLAATVQYLLCKSGYPTERVALERTRSANGYSEKQDIDK